MKFCKKPLFRNNSENSKSILKFRSLLSLNDNIDNWNYLPASSTTEEFFSDWVCCFTCGVSWPDQHVSLDCKECGGYSMNRPCVLCDGQCGALWKRDLSLVHIAKIVKG